MEAASKRHLPNKIHQIQHTGELCQETDITFIEPNAYTHLILKV